MQRLRAWWTFKHNSGHREQRIYVVDAAGLIKAGNGRRPAPRDIIQNLQRLADFARKEKIKLTAVVEGKPLHDAPGGDYNGIHVRFSGRPNQFGDTVVEVIKDGLRRNEVMVITSDARLEERVRVLGANTMRISTFQKAFGGGSDNRQEKRRPSNRRRRRRPDNKDNKDNDAPKQSDSDRAVHELLDLVE